MLHLFSLSVLHNPLWHSDLFCFLLNKMFFIRNFPSIFILSLLSISVKAYRPQEITLYSEENFKGRQKSFYESHSDLKSDSIGKIAKSHCVIRGLWRIIGTFNSTPGARFVENIYGDEKNGKVCGSWNTPNQTAEYQSLMLIGSQDLDTPAIQFHTKTRFYGEIDLYLDGRVLKLQQPMNFSSYGFTGRQNWTVFRNTDLTGHSQCLVANVDHDNDYVVSFNINKTLTVGSIWRGCGGLDPKVLGRQALDDKGSAVGVEEVQVMTLVLIIVTSISNSLLSSGYLRVSPFF